MRRILLTVIAAFGLLMLGTMSAQADDVAAAQPWQPLDTFDDGSGFAQQPSANSNIVDETTVDLVWADGITTGHGGTSLETANLGLEVTAGTEVSVSYQLLEGADPSSGAVRLFIYMIPDADTLNVAPCGPAGLKRSQCEAVAPDDGTDSGTLTITAPLDGTIGTAGLVYDTSNSAGGGVPGTVRFTGLKVGEDTVLFVEPEPEVCEWDDTLTADDEACVEPVDTDSDTTDEVDDDEQTGLSDGDQDTDGDPAAVPTAIPAGTELPETGAGIGLMALAGTGLIGTGVAMIWLRRRRPHGRYVA